MIRLLYLFKGKTSWTGLSSVVHDRLTAHCLKANVSLKQVVVQIVADSGEVTEAAIARYLDEKFS